MATRFNSKKNNPSSQVLTSKKKVLREFKKVQEALREIELEPMEGQEFYEQD